MAGQTSDMQPQKRSAEPGEGRSPAEPSFTVPLEYVPRKAVNVLEVDMGDGVILYNRDSDLVHHLNPTAGIVWQLFTGEATVDTLAIELSEECGLDVDRAREQVRSLAAQLHEVGLVQDARAGSPAGEGV